MASSISSQPPIEIRPPDISRFRQGNTGIEYVTTLDSGKPGPHVMVNALTHGNELCGAIVINQLMEEDIQPTRGKLTFSFANVSAFLQFNPANPFHTRYLDEDLNRVWSAEVLSSTRTSVELERARAMLPIINTVDHLLDIHSMYLDAPPLVIAGMQEKSLQLAQALGYPAHVVRDSGHVAGKRIRDFGEFDDPSSHKTAMLVECGQHWRKESITAGMATTLLFLRHFDLISDSFANALMPPVERVANQQIVEVTEPVTVKTTNFRFVSPYKGFEVIPRQGTVIGYDDQNAILTPYDNCVLVMPSPGSGSIPGATAVRLGRFVR